MSDLRTELKELIIEECEKDFEASDISNEEPLFGPDSQLELDSMDALQISMALHKNYGMKTTDSKKLKKIMTNIDSLAKHVESINNE